MSQLFRQEAIDKKKHRLSGVVSLVQPPIFKALALLLVTMTIVALVFLSLGNYTRKETVFGVVQPDSGVIRLSAPQAGIVSELLVAEGQQVEQGQPLLRITSEKHGAQGFELNQSLIQQHQSSITRLTEQLSQQKRKQQLATQALIDEQHSLQQQLAQLKQQSDIFEQRVLLNQQIIEQISGLAGTGYISDIELKKQKDNLLSLDQQTASINAQRLSLQQKIEQVSSHLAQLPIDHVRDHNQLKSQLVAAQSQLNAVKQQRLSEVRAPASGTVTGLLAHQGKSVEAQQKLLSILPLGSQMQAVIYVPTSAFGFIDKGQTTRLRYHAFPYQRFGIHQGKIDQISANVILPNETDIPGLISVPSYRVVVALQTQSIQAYGKNMPLRSGMKLDADIIIEKRSLIRWLFDPVFSIQGLH